MSRLDELTRMLAARTDDAGNPLKGYRRNVEMLRAEIAKQSGGASASGDSQKITENVSP